MGRGRGHRDQSVGQIWTFNRGAGARSSLHRPTESSCAPGARASFASRTRCGSTARGLSGWSTAVCTSCRKFTPEGKLLLTLGTPDEAGRRLNAFEPADRRGDRARRRYFRQPTVTATTGLSISTSTDSLSRTWGSLGSEPGQFSLPHSIALDSRGRLFVADRNNARVQVFDQTGRFLDEWRDLLVPWHIVITDRDEIYVCGSSPMRWPKLPIPGLIVGIPPKDQLVMVFTPDGRVTRLCTFPKGQQSGELDWVHALAVDRQGNLYLGDIQGRRAQKFLRLEPAGRMAEVAKKSLPKRDEPVQRAGRPQ